MTGPIDIARTIGPRAPHHELVAWRLGCPDADRRCSSASFVQRAPPATRGILDPTGTGTPDIGEAWARVQAALPEGWVIDSLPCASDALMGLLPHRT